jgi:hypothetical protein
MRGECTNIKQFDWDTYARIFLRQKYRCCKVHMRVARLLRVQHSQPPPSPPRSAVSAARLTRTASTSTVPPYRSPPCSIHDILYSSNCLSSLYCTCTTHWYVSCGCSHVFMSRSPVLGIYNLSLLFPTVLSYLPEASRERRHQVSYTVDSNYLLSALFVLCSRTTSCPIQCSSHLVYVFPWDHLL